MAVAAPTVTLLPSLEQPVCSLRCARAREGGATLGFREYRGISLISKRLPVGPYSRTMPKSLWGSSGGGCFF